jgi:hypothetical protein
MAEHYFQSVRLLTYQLLYSPSTRSNTSYPIPLLTLVPPTLSKRNRQRLTSDGAILVDAEPLTPTEPADGAEKLVALRLWALTQWHKICFIDARALVLEPGIESVFVDRAATLPVLAKGGNEAGAELPEDYLFAGLPVRNPGLEKGEVDGEGRRVGADLFVLRPDKVAFWYFQDLLRMPERFMEGGEEDGREGTNLFV